MVGVIVVWHVLLVRRRGVVPPIDARITTEPADRSHDQEVQR